jgi:hypothetical protein
VSDDSKNDTDDTESESDGSESGSDYGVSDSKEGARVVEAHICWVVARLEV